MLVVRRYDRDRRPGWHGDPHPPGGLLPGARSVAGRARRAGRRPDASRRSPSWSATWPTDPEADLVRLLELGRRRPRLRQGRRHRPRPGPALRRRYGCSWRRSRRWPAPPTTPNDPGSWACRRRRRRPRPGRRASRSSPKPRAGACRPTSSPEPSTPSCQPGTRGRRRPFDERSRRRVGGGLPNSAAEPGPRVGDSGQVGSGRST